MDKAIFFIGGSELQLPSIRIAKSLGLRVLLSDSVFNPPAKTLADAFVQISGDNSRALVDYVSTQSSNYQIISAYCGCDFGLASVALINQSLGLSGLDPIYVEQSLNKFRANQMLRDAGLPVPEGFMLTSNDSLLELDLKFPVIVKPVEGSGSRGVNFVDCQSQFAQALISARRISHDVLVEQVVEGLHIDVSGFFANGQFYPGGQLDRYFSPLPHRFPIWGCQPSNINCADQQNIYCLLEQSCRVLNLDWGPVKGDVILSHSGPVIIEVTPRFHGDVSTSFVSPLVFGLSPIEQWMKWLAYMELPQEQSFLYSSQKAGWAGIFPPQAGTVHEILGLDQAIEVPGVVNVLLRHGPGWRVNNLGDNTSVLGFIFATGSNSSQVCESLFAGLEKISLKMSPYRL